MSKEIALVQSLKCYVRKEERNEGYREKGKGKGKFTPLFKGRSQRKLTERF